MTTLQTANLRLPGVYFLPSPAPPGALLPPLDVTGFVGFAGRGPRDVPIPVEDPATYSAIFGGDATLARTQGGQPLYANLPTAVAGFFANGGRRCYVVRVAGSTAQPARFPLSGLAILGAAPEPRLASVSASSEGVWANSLQIGPRLQVTPLSAAAFRLTGTDGGATTLRWQAGGTPDAIQAGDLLRLTLGDGSRWLLAVEASAPDGPLFQSLRSAKSWRLASAQEIGTGLAISSVKRILPDDTEELFCTVFLTAVDSITSSLAASSGAAFQLAFFGTGATQLRRGDLLQLDIGGGAAYLLRVDSLSAPGNTLGSPRPDVVALATEMLCLPERPLPQASPGELTGVACLRLEFAVHEGTLQRPTVRNTGFNNQHPRFWGRVILLESSALYQASAADAAGSAATDAAALFQNVRSEQRSAQATDAPVSKQDLPGFAGLFAPLSDSESAATFLPVGLPSILTDADLAGAILFGVDGLETYQAGWFFDPLLVPRVSDGGPNGDEVFDPPASGSELLANAQDLYYVQERRLHGLHSLMFIDEVGLLALPDAVQPRWRLPSSAPPVVSPVVSPTPVAPPPDRSHFVRCEAPIVTSPALSPTVPAVTSPSLVDPTIPVADAPDPRDDTVAAPLLNAHQALIQFCEARQDVMGLLSLPIYYEKRQCLAWEQALRQKLQLPAQVSAFNDVAGLTDLSYAAVYHPWPQIADATAPDSLRAVPPDGVVCGTIAARELARQVWVAPANVPLAGVLGFTPVITEDDRATLFAAQFNILHTEARDFRAMSAHTLSDARIFLQISVRRLLIVLRKALLQRGQEYVFENNNALFREGVRQSLESLLRSLFNRGAFAGATPAQSYSIVTDASVNTPQSIDLGQFIVQIQVAPSQPTEFITVLLVRSGDNLLAVER